MEKLFVLLIVLIVTIFIGGCQSLEELFPFINKAPVILSEPVITAIEGNLYSYQVKANDPNGDTIYYSLGLFPEGMSIISENGLIDWLPTNNQVGIHRVVVEISDGRKSTPQDFEIEVSNMNGSPQILSYFPGNLNVNINEGDSVRFEIQAEDVDFNTILNYKWYLNGSLVSNSSVTPASGSIFVNNWTYSTDIGNSGQKTVKVIISDGALSDDVQWKINVNDVTPPSKPTLGAITSPTNISNQVLSGAKESNSSIWINGTEAVAISSNTAWLFSFNLSEGKNDISITSRDTAGNESLAVTADIVLDSIAPDVPTLNEVITPTNISPQILSGTKEVNSSIWINGTEAVVLNSSTAWLFSYNLSEGKNDISITSRDTAGNESTAVTANIVLDSIAPGVPTLNAVTSPTNIFPQTLSGSKEVNSSICINGIEAVALNSNTTWSYSFGLSEGTNNISITSRDALGNESSAITSTIKYDLNVYVDAKNVSGIENGTETYPFNTIAEGIEAAVSGKSVTVAAETYNEQLVINKGITLQGESKNNTFITGTGFTGNLITITADNIIISGFFIDGSDSTEIGIEIDNYSSITIENNFIKNNKDYGINYCDSNPTIQNNTIESNGSSGIDIGNGGLGTIQNNSITSSTYGIRACGDSSPEINNNYIISNSNSGIYCRDRATPIISYNTISDNSYCGVIIENILGNTVKPDIGNEYPSEGQSAGGNKITGNKNYGIYNKTNQTINAVNNWWGDAAGPKYPGDFSSSGDRVYWSETGGDIIFDPYLETEP